MIAKCPWTAIRSPTELRTIESITPTVRLNSSYSVLDPNGLLMAPGDGEYWIPHDDEALQLEQYA